MPLSTFSFSACDTWQQITNASSLQLMLNQSNKQSANMWFCVVGNSLICHPHSKAETWQFLSFRLEAYPFPFPFDFHCTASVAAFLFNLIFGSAQMLDWLWRHLCLCSDCCLCEPGKHTRTLTHMQMSGCEKATRPGQPNASEWDKRIGLRVDRRLTKGRPKLLARQINMRDVALKSIRLSIKHLHQSRLWNDIVRKYLHIVFSVLK